MTQPHRYIVIDDDRTNNLICQLIIQKFEPKAEIKLYTEPEDALNFIKEEVENDNQQAPTILLLDINMPTMTGWEFLDEMNKFDLKTISLFSIFMLSSSIEDFREKLQSYPFLSGFFSKPLQVGYLQSIHGEK